MAMEDFRVDVVIGKGPGATAIPLEIPPFTLVGATTRAGLLPGPLRDRFGFTAHLEFYERRRARPDRAPLGRPARRRRSTAEGAAEIASRSRGTPAHRQPAAAPGPRLRPGPRRRRRHPRRRPRRARPLRGRRARASTGSTGPSSTCCAAASAADRSASPRSRSRSARSARPSRRSPSRSWSASASWPVRRGAGSPPPAAWQHLGLDAPPAPAAEADRSSSE